MTERVPIRGVNTDSRDVKYALNIGGIPGQCHWPRQRITLKVRDNRKQEFIEINLII